MVRNNQMPQPPKFGDWFRNDVCRYSKKYRTKGLSETQRKEWDFLAKKLTNPLHRSPKFFRLIAKVYEKLREIGGIEDSDGFFFPTVIPINEPLEILKCTEIWS